MKRRQLMIGVALVAAIVLAVALGYLTAQNGPMACTEEAKMCPDGSSVGRTGPNCAFAPCPSPSPVTLRAVKLAFYNPEFDKDASGNVMCSAKGIVTVPRDIPFTNTPIQDTIRLLLASKPSADDVDVNLVSQFPLAGVALTAASLTGGVLTLTFKDPNNRTGGGSCFVSILRAQIEATAKQFSGVREVRLMPEELFQP